MIEKSIPVLGIKQFQDKEGEDSFYANIFSEHLTCNHTTISTPHKHDFYLSVYFTHGQGTHEIDFQEYPISPGSIFFLHPAQTHNWKLSDDIEGYIFFHTRNFYDSQYARKSILDFSIFHSTLVSPHLQLDANQSLEIIPTFQKLLSEYPLKSISRAERVCSILDVFYIEVSELSGQNNTSSTIKSSIYNTQFKQLEQLIEIHFRQKKLPSEYAEEMNISSKHLNRICNSSIKKTTSQLINERVILEAKRMLVNPNNDLTFTAYQLGFKDYAYFSRWFKRQTGQTPSQFTGQYFN